MVSEFPSDTDPEKDAARKDAGCTVKPKCDLRFETADLLELLPAMEAEGGI